jgi:hypothetical protein
MDCMTALKGTAAAVPELGRRMAAINRAFTKDTDNYAGK